VPRAPLPVTSVTHDRVASSTTSKGVTPSSSLLRAHAPNQFPPPEFVHPHLSPEVLAGCCEPPAGNRFFPTLSLPVFPRMLEPLIPSGGRVHMPVTSPTSSAFPKSRQWVGFPESPRKETSCGGCFEIVAIPYVQASWFARHPGLPYRCVLEGRRAAVTFPPEQITHRYQCAHRVC
jgi:hypothetical protein